ncbi:MAG: winged helix-turn-helix domain-containing protein, partial [Methanomassiliicoccales archaeon]|nr:winged helix-turn-helix domain-containing protein [Methanomassiliicoccales archaeon]
AMLQLEELGALMELMIGSGPGADRLRMLLDAVNNTRQQMALMETLRSKVGRPMLRRSCESVFGGMEPEEVEALLSPLSSAVRLKILAMLYTSSRNFTEISKELDMKKGHLQFHLRKLVKAGYVRIDPRTHLYSIEERAFLIMEGLSKLFSQIK